MPTTPSPPLQATGILSVLLADLRGYTRYTAEFGDEAAARLTDRFAAMAESVVESWNGRVVELRGDEVMAVFASARDAVRAAHDLDRRAATALADGSLLPVGMGLDAGDLVPLRGGYRGAALNLAARLCALAGPGEIFASRSIAHLTGTVEGIEYVDRGPVHLKGLVEPVQVLQIGAAGVEREIVPLERLVHEPANNLPDDATPFVGREAEVAEVTALLREPHCRLVTVTGPGGIGKTRLVLQAGSVLLYDFPDGVFFVPLALVDEPGQVPAAIAQAVGLRQTGGEPIDQVVEGHFKERRALFILDNMEHVLDAADALGALLTACRSLHVLVSSRSLLRLAREQEFLLLPMDVPRGSERDLDRVGRSDAVRLFVARARAANSKFDLTATNVDAVVGICARVEGVPLALELAASRIRLFPPRALLERLSTHLLELTGNVRDMPRRQQTLRATIEWSFDLLSEPERRLCACLSVFVGGCTLEAVEAVVLVDGDVSDELLSLVDKSLLRQGGDDEPRFTMLEIIREYALEQLRLMGREADLRPAHAGYYLQLATTASAELRGSRQKEWMDQLEREHDNLRAALGYYMQTGNATSAVAMVNALRWFWWARGYLSEGRERMDDALALGGDDPSTARAGALSGAGTLAWAQGDFEAAAARYAESLALYQTLQDRAGASMSLNNLGMLAEQQGEFAQAADLYGDAMELLRQEPDPWRTALVLGNLGGVLAYLAEYERSIALCEESLQLRRAQGDSLGAVHVLNTLVWVLLETGETERAAVYACESLDTCREAGVLESLTVSLEGAAKVLASRERPREAATIWGAAEALRDALGQPLSPVGQQYKERYVAHLERDLGTDGLRRDWNDGRGLTPERASDLALAALATRSGAAP